jgi:hypothetical protein
MYNNHTVPAKSYPLIFRVVKEEREKEEEYKER